MAIERATADEALNLVKAIAVARGSDVRVADKARIIRMTYTQNVEDLANPL
ncbi:MAG TPA: hypothetical protein VIK77_08085 [Tissierellaceae bacterium]